MMTGVPSYPIYYSTNKRSHTSLEYVKNMAYIPGVLPSVPPRPGPSAHAKPQGKKLVTETHESGFHGASSPPSWRRSATDTSSIPQLIEASTAPAGSRHGKGAAQPPQKQKRAFEAKESPEPAEDDQPKSKRKKANQGVQDHEKALIARYMQEEIDNRNLTESKWQNVTEKLKSHGIDRSGHSVKAWWSRHGRQEFGIDERKNPHGRKLVTSKQDPEERRKARERKRREAVEGKCSNDHKKTKTARSLQKPDGSDEEDKVEDDDELAEAPT